MKKIYIYGDPNGSVFFSSTVAFSEILGIYREGLQYDEISGTPVGRQAKYETSGKFTFDSSIFDGSYTVYVPDKILILYK